MRRHLEDVVSVEVVVECYLSRVGRNGRAPSGVKDDRLRKLMQPVTYQRYQ